ncbi:SET domain [Nesidiocoris tenuis]|uniref:SET domain n=1 Tax=Nesidiocoris tenuis TaxID=355587 RepID=A0ABN7ACZ0_9HEMI|nr:SET domain [Nesidiocoris tenuis]
MKSSLDALLAEREASVSRREGCSSQVLTSSPSALGGRKWAVKPSAGGGRGLFAIDDIQSGELIFSDLPIITGPRTREGIVGCVVCGKINKPLANCSKNCRLPICSQECEKSPAHESDCNLLRCLTGGQNKSTPDWSPFLYRSLALIRCLNMNDQDRRLVAMLHANRGKQVQRQVSELVAVAGGSFNNGDVRWLEHCCGVLDGTAFEIELTGTGTSLKGLFPLAAMMNHNCTPNTRSCCTTGTPSHSCDYRMLVIASRPIAKGAEILTSYCPLMWSNSLRRPYLAYSKHFICNCQRCCDPTEFETYLQATKCQCGGIMLPLDSLNFNSEWSCCGCGKREGSRVITDNYASLNPDCGYISVQLKTEHVFKSTKNDSIKGLADSDLAELLQNCTEVLQILDKLKLEKSTIKGKLCGRLEIIVQEMKLRRMALEESTILNYLKCGHIIREEDEEARAIFCHLKPT